MLNGSFKDAADANDNQVFAAADDNHIIKGGMMDGLCPSVHLSAHKFAKGHYCGFASLH